jgi:DivIVA domain-containing protein
VDQITGIERIRTATFTLARRGYDKREVEQFLNRIADWLETGGGDETRAGIVKRELERVGHHTAGILASAEDSAEQIRADATQLAEQTTDKARAAATATRESADEYAEKTRHAADAYAAKVRQEADEYDAQARKSADLYAGKTREAADLDAAATLEAAEKDAAMTLEDADHEARNRLDAAEAKAKRVVDEGAARRRDIEAVISDLVEHRDGVIMDAKRLAAELREVADGHSYSGESDPFAKPEEPDPSERVGA